MALPQVNSRRDADTGGTVVGIQDCARIKKSIIQTIAHNAIANISFGEVVYDPLGGSWDAGSPGNLVVPRAGLKWIYLNVYMTINTARTAEYDIRILLTGAGDATGCGRQSTNFSSNTDINMSNRDVGCNIAVLMNCSAGDIFTAQIIHWNSVALTRTCQIKTNFGYSSASGDP